MGNFLTIMAENKSLKLHKILFYQRSNIHITTFLTMECISVELDYRINILNWVKITHNIMATRHYPKNHQKINLLTTFIVFCFYFEPHV